MNTADLRFSIASKSSWVLTISMKIDNFSNLYSIHYNRRV